MAGRTARRTSASKASSSQGASATKWCKDWCMRCTLLGANLAAIGSTLLRSPGSKRPLQYDFNGSIRSACPAACARPWKYAAKRFCCGPGADDLPTKQFYNEMFFYNTVVLGVESAFPGPGGTPPGKFDRVQTRPDSPTSPERPSAAGSLLNQFAHRGSSKPR